MSDTGPGPRANRPPAGREPGAAPSPAGSANVDPDRQRLIGVVLMVVAVIIGMILLFRGLSTAEDVMVSEPDAQATSTTIDRDAPPPTDVAQTTVPSVPAPAEVTVVVANGSGVSGLAGSTTEALAADGFVTLPATDALTSAASTRVYYTPDNEGAATAVAEALELPSGAVAPLPASPPVSDVGAAQVVVVLGSDFPVAGE